MIEPAKFLLFMGVSWALIIAPGPDMLYVITRGMAHGRRAGVLSAVGVVCGILVHTTAAAFGLTRSASPYGFIDASTRPARRSASPSAM